MAKYCPNCGKSIAEEANYCPSCGAYITGNVREKLKEFKENIEIFNLVKEVHIFTVYVIAFTAALYAWEILNIPSWEWRLFGSLATGVIAVFATQFILNRYLLSRKP